MTTAAYAVVLILAALDPPAVTTRTGAADADAVRTCGTTFLGPPTAPFGFVGNWTAGLPTADMPACEPRRDAASALPHTESAGVHVGGPAASGVAADPNTPPTATGACCLGSSCAVLDYFDCREAGGHFLDGVIDCTASPCASGCCCLNTPSCRDDDGAGGAMETALCDTLSGNYIGGALCDSADACQRFRLPAGFEIVEVTPGTENWERRRPRMNNCGEIVFHMEPSPDDAEIFLYDNGRLAALTDDSFFDAFPDINDRGAIVWVENFDSFGGGNIKLFDRGEARVISEGTSPSINNVGHIAWQVSTPFGCKLTQFMSDIYSYDGEIVIQVFHDGLSNQSVEINERDGLIWTRYLFPCDGSWWTSNILMRDSTGIFALPSNADPPDAQAPDLNNNATAVWMYSGGYTQRLERWESGVTANFGEGAGPAISDRGDVVAFDIKSLSQKQS